MAITDSNRSARICVTTGSGKGTAGSSSRRQVETGRRSATATPDAPRPSGISRPDTSWSLIAPARLIATSTRSCFEPKEDRAIGTGHIQRLRHDRLRDLREVEASHERLARPMEDVEVPLPRARLAIEPHLLPQEPDEDDADADRSREARQVPRNAVPKGADQNPDQPQHPDIRGEEQVTGERITREVSA